MTDFEAIYELYFKDVYRYALSLAKNEALAEEITQETFFKALKSIDRFDGRCRLYVWLCQIAKNTYLNLLKKEKKHRQFPETDESPENIELDFVNRESALEIHRILHRLEEPYKEVFSLRTFGELSFLQIAALFDKTESWARVTYYRAKCKIKEELP